MANDTLVLDTYTKERLQRVAGNILGEFDAQRDVMAARISAAMVEAQPGWLTSAKPGTIDLDFVYAPDVFTEFFTTGPAYKTGDAAKRIIGISTDFSDAYGKVHNGDGIVVTHLALEALSPIVLADLDNIKEDLRITISAPGNTARPQLVKNDRLADWLTWDMHQLSAIRNVTAGAGTGRDIFELPKYGTWENGLRKLPRPMWIPDGQFGEYQIDIRNGSAPSATSGFLFRTRFRYSRIRGVTGK